MSAFGGGIIAIWHDIAAAGLQDFYEWHNREHVPERVSIEGFLRGRRYIATKGRPDFFTLYNVREAAVLASRAYHDRLNNPTPWTLRAVEHFSAEARSLCETLISSAIGSGGLIGTLRFDTGFDNDPALLRHLGEAMKGILATPLIVGFHACRTDLETSKRRSAEQQGRSDNMVPRWVVLVEGTSTEAVSAILEGPLGVKALAPFGVPADAARSVYTLQHDLNKSQLQRTDEAPR